MIAHDHHLARERQWDRVVHTPCIDRWQIFHIGEKRRKDVVKTYERLVRSSLNLLMARISSRDWLVLRNQLGKEKDMLPLKIIATSIAFISVGLVFISWRRIPETRQNQRGLILAGGASSPGDGCDNALWTINFYWWGIRVWVNSDLAQALAAGASVPVAILAVVPPAALLVVIYSAALYHKGNFLSDHQKNKEYL